MATHNHMEPVKPRRVLLLGGSGFLGRAILQQFRKEAIPLVVPTKSDLDLLSASSVRTLQKLSAPGDVLIVAAGLTPDRGRDSGTMLQNLEMANNISTFLRDSGSAHVVYVSSDAVYRSGGGPLNETSRCDSDELYGVMHYMRERIFAEAAAATAVPYLVLRPCAMYGRGDTHNSYGPNRFVRTATQAGTITLIGEGEEGRDHLCVDDFARFLTECVLHRSEGVLNVATGRAVSFQAVAQLVRKHISSPVIITSRPRTNAITHRHFDIANAIRAFPHFIFTPLEEGIRRMLQERLSAAAQ